MEASVPNRDEWFTLKEGFPRPEWEAIIEWISAAVPEEQWHSAWDRIALIWLERLKSSLHGDYSISGSANFIILAPTSVERHATILRFLESTKRRILNALAELSQDDAYGRHVVLVFQTIDEFYGYVGFYYPESEEIPQHGGVFLSDRYMHFAVETGDFTNLAPVLVHELSHNCVAHLPLPLWFNEGLSMALENAIVGSSPLLLDREAVEKHQAFWNDQTIQEYWSGESFHRADDGGSLSYQLSQVLMLRINEAVGLSSPRFRKFAGTSHFNDAGLKAAHDQLGLSLPELIEDFLGPGDWAPKPELWKKS